MNKHVIFILSLLISIASVNALPAWMQDIGVGARSAVHTATNLVRDTKDWVVTQTDRQASLTRKGLAITLHWARENDDKIKFVHDAAFAASLGTLMGILVREIHLFLIQHPRMIPPTKTMLRVRGISSLIVAGSSLLLLAARY